MEQGYVMGWGTLMLIMVEEINHKYKMKKRDVVGSNIPLRKAHKRPNKIT